MLAGSTRSRSSWVYAAATAAVFFVLAGLASPAAAAGVDVAVVTQEITFSNANPVDGQNITILIVVRNFGDTAATDVLVQASETSTGILIGTATLSSVPSQGQAQTGISWNVSGVGAKTVTVSVSPSGIDANPENNVAVSQTINVRARPDLRINSVTFDNPTPAAGSGTATIYAQVANVGGSDASMVTVALFDGNPADGAPEIYRATLVSVPVSTPQTLSYVWDITNKGGRHDVHAVVIASTPAESPDKTGNNDGSGTLLVLTSYDQEITEARTIDRSTDFQGFLIVRSGGDLTMRSSTFTLHQERDHQFDIIVEDGGTLRVVGASIYSDYRFGLTLRSGGTVIMSGGAQFQGSISASCGSLAATDATIGGDVVGCFHPITLNASTVVGEMALTNSQAEFNDAHLEGNDPVLVSATTLTATGLFIEAAEPVAMQADTGSVVEVRGLVSGPVVAMDTSTVAVWRLVQLSAHDFTGIPIGGADVDITFYISQLGAGSVTTDGAGTAAVWLLTDQVTVAGPQYVGSYLFDASFAGYGASAVENLPYYPTLTFESSVIAVELTFPVIDPSDIFAPTPGDKTVAASAPWPSIGSYTLDGNLFVAGQAHFEGGDFFLDQDRDFEKAIVLTGGTFELVDATLSSNFKFNVYLFNASQFNARNTQITANTIVMFGSSSVSITDGSTLSANLILPGGASLTLGSGTVVEGALLWARQAPSIVMRGATVSIGTIEVLTTGDFTMNATALTFGGHAVLRSTSPTSTFTIVQSTITGPSVEFEAGVVQMEGSMLDTPQVTRIWAGTVQMRTTDVAGAVAGLKNGSTVALYDVTYESLTADPSAVVNIFHSLSFSILDVNGNPVADGTYAIRAMPNGTSDVASGQLASSVRQDLHAASIVNGVEVFDGNYRLTVTLEGASPTVRYVVVDTPKVITFPLSAEVVDPTSFEIQASASADALNRGEEISFTGAISLHYAGRADTLLPRTPVSLHIVAGSVDLGNVTVAADGSFNWTGNFSVGEGDTGPVRVTITGSYRGVNGQAQLFVEVLVPPPTKLDLVLDNTRFEKRQNEDFILSGSARYGDGTPAEGVKIRVYFTLPPQAQDYFATTDANGLWAVTVPGRRTASTYSIAVVATNEALALNSIPQGVTVEVIGIEGPGGGDLGEFALPALLIAIAAIGAIGGFLVWNARRSSVNYVECGNCGKPVHEGEKQCPSCGVEFEEDIAKCSHCNSWIPADESRCPKCNTEFKPVDEAVSTGGEAPAAPDAKEDVRAEVTTTAEPVKAVKQPVAVKKKVLKRAVEPGKEEGGSDEAPDPFAESDGSKADDLVTAKPGGEAKEGEKKEKGLFDDL
jgi:hypothetical protein